MGVRRNIGKNTKIKQFTSIYIHLHPFTSIYIHLHPFTSIYIHLHPFTSIYIAKSSHPHCKIKPCFVHSCRGHQLTRISPESPPLQKVVSALSQNDCHTYFLEKAGRPESFLSMPRKLSACLWCIS